MTLRLPLLAFALGAAFPAAATEADLRSVAGMQYHDRVLLVFAPSLHDARLARQQAIMAGAALDAAARDLIFVQVAGDAVIGARDDATRLRRHYKVSRPDYRTLLIGKDGNVALSAPGPIERAQLIGAIDAMPMRREEMRRARAAKGAGKP